MPSEVWTLVLAGGAGRRLAPVTGGIPKQFWRPDGDGSLLEGTLARVAPFAPASRAVVVVDRTHRPHLEAMAASSSFGHVVYQPADRGTAAGVLLALMPVIETGPGAVVVLTPSDHGVRDVAGFQAGLADTVHHVAAGVADIVLLGIAPSAANGDYGWIEGTPAVAGLSSVVRFVEKPPAEAATALLASGAVWNTMVLVARASALFELFERSVPELTAVFKAALRQPRSERESFLAARYRDLPTLDFSHDVVTPAQGLLLYTWPASIGWSDLGTPQRLREWLAAERAVRAGARRREPISVGSLGPTALEVA